MSGSDFESYHLVWLSAHPHRSAEWLKEMLRDGFHVHHVDGDHYNDAPNNLVLIDGVDHLRLHGMKLRDGIKKWRSRRLSTVEPKERSKKHKPEASVIYAKKAEIGGSWLEFAKIYYSGIKPTDGAWHDIGARLSIRAKKYAEENEKSWPPQAAG